MELAEDRDRLARIRVVGVGGAGGNAINRMVVGGLSHVEFVAMNTDAQALAHVPAGKKICLGENLTRGLGAGSDPAMGAKAGEESADLITAALQGSDLVFVAMGLGGGTGTGAGPIVARIARQMGALVVCVVTLPFAFEGRRRATAALAGLAALREHVDTLIVIPNDRLLRNSPPELTLTTAFKMADEILHQAVSGLADLVTVPGLINLDFADLRAVMANAGTALMAVGAAEGPERARVAAKAALQSPLLGLEVSGAHGVVFNVTGGHDMRLIEVQIVAEIIGAAAHPDATLIFGAVTDEKYAGKLQVTVVASGFAEGLLPVGMPVVRGGIGVFGQPTQSIQGIERMPTDILPPPPGGGADERPFTLAEPPSQRSPSQTPLPSWLEPFAPPQPTVPQPVAVRQVAHQKTTANPKAERSAPQPPPAKERESASVPSYLRRLWR